MSQSIDMPDVEPPPAMTEEQAGPQGMELEVAELAPPPPPQVARARLRPEPSSSDVDAYQQFVGRRLEAGLRQTELERSARQRREDEELADLLAEFGGMHVGLFAAEAVEAADVPPPQPQPPLPPPPPPPPPPVPAAGVDAALHEERVRRLERSKTSTWADLARMEGFAVRELDDDKREFVLEACARVRSDSVNWAVDVTMPPPPPHLRFDAETPWPGEVPPGYDRAGFRAVIMAFASITNTSVLEGFRWRVQPPAGNVDRNHRDHLPFTLFGIPAPEVLKALVEIAKETAVLYRWREREAGASSSSDAARVALRLLTEEEMLCGEPSPDGGRRQCCCVCRVPPRRMRQGAGQEGRPADRRGGQRPIDAYFYRKRNESYPIVRIAGKPISLYHALPAGHAMLWAAAWKFPEPPMKLEQLLLMKQGKGVEPWSILHACGNGGGKKRKKKVGCVRPFFFFLKFEVDFFEVDFFFVSLLLIPRNHFSLKKNSLSLSTSASGSAKRTRGTQKATGPCTRLRRSRST